MVVGVFLPVREGMEKVIGNASGDGGFASWIGAQNVKGKRA